MSSSQALQQRTETSVFRWKVCSEYGKELMKHGSVRIRAVHRNLQACASKNSDGSESVSAWSKSKRLREDIAQVGKRKGQTQLPVGTAQTQPRTSQRTAPFVSDQKDISQPVILPVELHRKECTDYRTYMARKPRTIVATATKSTTILCHNRLRLSVVRASWKMIPQEHIQEPSVSLREGMSLGKPGSRSGGRDLKGQTRLRTPPLPPRPSLSLFWQG